MTEARLVTREQLAAALRVVERQWDGEWPNWAQKDMADAIFAALPAAAPASGYMVGGHGVANGGNAPAAAPAEGLREAAMLAYRMLWENWSQAADWEQIIRQDYGEGGRAIGHTWIGKAARALSDALGPEDAEAAKHPTYAEAALARHESGSE